MDDFDIHEPADPIVIGNDCWIGAGAIILPGVNLGDHVVVAAGAIVTKSFECNQLIGGVPARVISGLPPYSGSSDWGVYD
ncbi:DapH/DapD/GlmU-related protein [Luteimonas sp. 8-5]|uniref:DapH/DapD/GlmU-related protein n=1 Tax=Luteimonas sp. 8-5 TaxID=3039387 RepID=UPI002436B8E1|nr:DapH/DapD/GlmU-related protein [Luteimonas sp. 8-5]MDG6348291.1 DapH/DapD/GlmU-related protein [Luteimonas sp. 8-5]